MMKERAKILAKAMMGGETPIPKELCEDGPVRPIREMMEELLKIEDDDWGLYAFTREPLEGKFTREQRYDYIRNANSCGCMEARAFVGKSEASDSAGGIGKAKKLNGMAFESLTKSMDISLETPEIPVGGGHVIFAQYTEPNKIIIFMDAVKKAEALILDNHMQDILKDVSIYHLLLAHELFHVVEYKNETTIYTKTEKVELWKKPFSNRSRIGALSEIAGMAFAKELLALDYSPFALDVLLMYGYSPAAASALYEEIMDIVCDRNAQ